MSAARILFDTAVLIYAVGGDHAYREPCRRLLAASFDIGAEVSVLAVEEFLHQRTRRTGDRAEAGARARDLLQVLRVHDLTRDDVEDALHLHRTVEGLDAADACHAATALRRGVHVIVSPDEAFDGVHGLERQDPAAAAATLS